MFTHLVVISLLCLKSTCVGARDGDTVKEEPQEGELSESDKKAFQASIEGLSEEAKKTKIKDLQRKFEDFLAKGRDPKDANGPNDNDAAFQILDSGADLLLEVARAGISVTEGYGGWLRGDSISNKKYMVL